MNPHCEYCGLETYGSPEMGDRFCRGVLHDEGLCDGGGELKEFCPRCGDHLGEDQMTCSCDRQD